MAYNVHFYLRQKLDSLALRFWNIAVKHLSNFGNAPQLILPLTYRHSRQQLYISNFTHNALHNARLPFRKVPLCWILGRAALLLRSNGILVQHCPSEVEGNHAIQLLEPVSFCSDRRSSDRSLFVSGLYPNLQFHNSFRQLNWERKSKLDRQSRHRQ